MRLQMLGQLADGGGFANAVDPRDHHDQRLMLAKHQRLFQRLEQIDQQCAQGRADLIGLGQFQVLDLLLEGVQQKTGCVHAGIRHQERRFQFFI
jgi:hypothetical protein